jgi:argininosuccinate lyase
LVQNFNVNAVRALEEVNQDYSTTASLAEILQRDANVPFRIGHHFASELTNFGRSHNLYPNQIPYTEAKRIYKEATEGQVLPFNENKFREALSAEYLVFNQKGLGGSYLREVERILGEQNSRLTEERTRVKTQIDRLYSTQAKLDKEIDGYILKASGKKVLQAIECFR